MNAFVNSTILAPIIGAIVGFAVWFFQSRIDKINKEREKLYVERREIYSKILDPYIRVLTGIKNPKESDKAMKHILSFDYKKTAFELTLMGSDEVIKAFNKFMKFIYNMQDGELSESEMKEFLKCWGNFLLVIRRNSGNRKTKLTGVEMLCSMINDIDNYLD